MLQWVKSKLKEKPAAVDLASCQQISRPILSAVVTSHQGSIRKETVQNWYRHEPATAHKEQLYQIRSEQISSSFKKKSPRLAEANVILPNKHLLL